MATNWSLFDGAKAILANDEAAIAELGKRFPLTTVAIAAMGNNENAMKIFEALPINVTMRKVEANLKGGVEDTDSESDSFDGDDVENEQPKKSKRMTDEEKKAAAAERRKARRAAKKAEKKAEEDEEEEIEAEEEAEGTDYSSMNAVELFKECKKRGIKAAPKQKAAEYIKLLKAADAEEEDFGEEDTDEEDDGWGDDEEEEAMPAPTKKKAGRPAKGDKTTAKSSKKASKVEEDEDDDWDI